MLKKSLLAVGTGVAAIAAVALAFPMFVQADITSLSSSSLAGSQGPLSCYDLKSTLKSGSTGYEVRGLQFDLIQEGASIPASEYGTFGTATLAGVNAFQQKYNLAGGPPTGFVGKATRAKLNSLYGCALAGLTGTKVPASIILNVKNIVLDSNGVTVTACNLSPTEIPAFPLRIRLNGINRDFNVTGALKAGACDVNTISYGTWGLTYDPGSTFGVTTILDPNAMYRLASNTYQLSASTTLTVPAIQGAHLSVRGISIKSNGVQGTLCNLGTADLPSFPVRVTVNGISKDVDVVGAHPHGVCTTVTWTYDLFGLVNPAPGSSITSTVNVDPNNLINETNEFDNSATTIGTI